MLKVILAAVGAAAVIAATAVGADHKPAHGHGVTAGSKLAAELARARLATAPFATSVAKAKARGYTMQIAPNMPGMGFHFLNPKVQGFDAAKPPILV